MQKIHFNEDTVIFNQGVYEETMYSILEGTVSIYENYGTKDELFLTTLVPGRYFGEMGVLESRPRSATAVAHSGTTVEMLGIEDLEDYFCTRPDRAIDLFETVTARLRELSEDYAGICLLAARYVDTEDSVKKTGILASLNSLFTRQSHQDVAAQVRALSHNTAALRSVSVEKGAVICREGEVENWMYDIRSGSAGVYTAYGTEEEKLLTVLKAQDTFGEVAMIEHCPRSATVVALEETTLRVITEDQFMTYFAESPAKVYIILRNTAARVRELSRQFADAYRTVMEYIDAERLGPPYPAGLVAKVRSLASGK